MNGSEECPKVRRCQIANAWASLQDLYAFSQTVEDVESPDCEVPVVSNSNRRRHSMMDMSVNLSDIKLPKEQNSSFRSNSSLSSFVGREYKQMLDEWCVRDVDDDMMVFSGLDFKELALRPAAVSTTPNDHKACETEDESASNPRHEGQVCDSLKSQATKTPIRRTSSSFQRRSSIVTSCVWPEYSGSAEDLSVLAGDLQSFSFCALNHSSDDLAIFVFEMFSQMDLIQFLNVPESRIQNFILSVRARMLDNAYHNWTHVVDVAQTVYSLSVQSGLYERLSPVHRVSLMVAALCHDLEHPGVSASYLLKSNSALAARYKKDPGLLEKHHSVRAFELIASADCCLLGGLSRPNKVEVIRLVREIILATDMSRHGVFMGVMNARIKAAAKAVVPIDAVVDEFMGLHNEEQLKDNVLLVEMQLLLKCSDISNVLKPFHVAREWAARVTDEFFSQGDMERTNGLEVTAVCDRTSQSRVALQKAFIDNLAAPFHNGIVQLFPRLAPLLDQMDQNRRRWETYADQALVFYMSTRRGCSSLALRRLSSVA